MEQRLDEFCAQFLKYQSEQTSMVIVTMVDYKGSAPQDPGARMIVGEKGLLFGTVGGGKIEKKCLDVAAEQLSSKKRVTPFSQTWNLQRDIGMSCGGEVTMFFEVHHPREAWNVAVFGAGHVSQELTRLLVKLDCQLTVIDSRQEWLDKLPSTNPRFKTIRTDDLAGVLKTLPPKTFVALMTMGHAHDLPILKVALNEHDFPFVGVIGSKAKRNRLEAELGKTNFHCPLGEDFGSNAPVEIALSMVAQLLKERDRLLKEL